MSTAYALIGLNSLFMFFGSWIYHFRVFSVYFTFFACLIQFVLLMVVASMLFSKYSNLCRLSQTNTFKYYRWTIHDDFVFTEGIWVASLFLMFIFVSIGLIQAYQPVGLRDIQQIDPKDVSTIELNEANVLQFQSVDHSDRGQYQQAEDVGPMKEDS